MRAAFLFPLALAVFVALGVGGCANTEVKTPIPTRDDFGHPVPLVVDPVGAWQWHVETQRMAGAIQPPVQSLGGGLRVGVSESPGLSGTADMHEAAEGTPMAIPVGRCIWPKPPHVSSAVVAGGWSDVEVEVAWVVLLRARGSCAVEIEAVPRLSQRGGCPSVILSDLAVRRVLRLDEALMIGNDLTAPSAAQAAALVGANGGQAGRFAIRVRR